MHFYDYDGRFNIYSYVSGNPLTYRDPRGLDRWGGNGNGNGHWDPAGRVWVPPEGGRFVPPGSGLTPVCIECLIPVVRTVTKVVEACQPTASNKTGQNDGPVFNPPTRAEREASQRSEQVTPQEAVQLRNEGYVPVNEIPGGTPYSPHPSKNGWVFVPGGTGWGTNPGSGFR